MRASVSAGMPIIGQVVKSEVNIGVFMWVSVSALGGTTFV